MVVNSHWLSFRHIPTIITHFCIGSSVTALLAHLHLHPLDLLLHLPYPLLFQLVLL